LLLFSSVFWERFINRNWFWTDMVKIYTSDANLGNNLVGDMKNLMFYSNNEDRSKVGEVRFEEGCVYVSADENTLSKLVEILNTQNHEGDDEVSLIMKDSVNAKVEKHYGPETKEEFARYLVTSHDQWKSNVEIVLCYERKNELDGKSEAIKSDATYKVPGYDEALEAKIGSTNSQSKRPWAGSVIRS